MPPAIAAVPVDRPPIHVLPAFHRRTLVWLRCAAPWLLALMLGLAIGRLPVRTLIAASLLVLGVYLMLRWPATGLIGLAFAIPFGSLQEFSISGLSIGASELLLAATLTCWLLRMLASRRLCIRGGRLLLPMGAWAAMALSAAWPAQDMLPAIKELAKWIEFLALYACTCSLSTPGSRRALIAALLLAGAAQGVVGIRQFLLGIGPEGFLLFGRFMRASGTFLQPNPFAGYLGLLLPLAYAVAFAGWRSVLRQPGAPRPNRIALTLLATVSGTLMATGLVMSWSRGALLGLLAGLVLVILRIGRRAWMPLLILSLLLAVTILQGASTWPFSALAERLYQGSAYLGQNLGAIDITDANFAVIERLAHWQAAWRMFSQRPWLGVGIGQYATIYPTVALARWVDPLGHAHNYYLHVLAEMGIIGLAVMLAFWTCCFIAVWRRAKPKSLAPDARTSMVYSTAALGTLGYLATHNVFDNLFVHEMYLLVALLMALAMSAPATTKSLSTEAV